jgi:maltose O-acetyltransferase
MADERERMLAGAPYDPEDPDLVADRRRARRLARAYNRTGPDETARRRSLLADLFGSVGDGVTVEPPVRCDYGDNLYVGDGFYANVGCVFLDTARLSFGANCLLGPGVHVYAATHPLDAADRAAGLERAAPVTVSDDVWIGGRAVLTPGTTVGDRAVVAAGAVVTEDVPPDTLVGGNPAEPIRELD